MDVPKSKKNELIGDFELGSEPIVFVSSSSSSKMVSTIFHVSNFFPASDEPAEKTFEQTRGETKTMEQFKVIDIGVNPLCLLISAQARNCTQTTSFSAASSPSRDRPKSGSLPDRLRWVRLVAKRPKVVDWPDFFLNFNFGFWAV